MGGGVVEVNQRRDTCWCKYSTKQYYYGIKLRYQISAAFLEKKLISAAALIRVNSVHFLMHCET